MKLNSEYTAEFHSLIKKYNGDINGRRKAHYFMKHSTAIYHNEVIKYVCTPKLLNRETYHALSSAVTMIHGILCKVMRRYIKDPQYRDVFEYDPRLVDLILLPRGYNATLPFARFDVFFDENSHRIRFCEFNADGSSGMNENLETTQALSFLDAYKKFSESHMCTPCELHESWVDEFLSIYKTFEQCVSRPRVAICDFLENAVIDEFVTYSQIFQTRGIECEICDMRDLMYRNKVLYGKEGKRIDAVWRRCVTNDIIDNWDDSQSLLDAVREKSVALIGSFAGHIVHDKQIFMVLRHEDTMSFLSDDERVFLERTIPHTVYLSTKNDSLKKAKSNKNRWIIKPTDNYGATDVYAGIDYDTISWGNMIEYYADGRTGQRFLLQEYCEPFETLTLPPDNGIEALSDLEIPQDPIRYKNLSGLYAYNGRFVGVFSRLGPNPTISASADGVTAASIWVD